MYLKRLEIQGFKSFAYKTAFEFTPGIICVVGPNGSGKSNVADAVRWVMGEQSLKVLRGKKSEDVIFAGSDKKTRLGAAEVSLHIDNADRVMPIDYAEVIVTRRIYRNGEGEYLINKKPVRLQDILLLLAKSNFGQHTYSVIAQGMIDYFIMASPRDRKDLFDEAAGVRQYQIKKEQAVLKLDRTKENLGQAEVLLNEISPRLRSLTRQVRRWERREEIEKDLREKQVNYYNYLYQDIFEQYNHSQKDHLAQEKEAQQVKGVLEGLQAKLDGMAREGTRSEIFQNLQKEYQRFLDKKNSLLQEKTVLEGAREIEHLNQGNIDLSFLEKSQKELKGKIINHEKDLKELKAKISAEEIFFEEKIKDQKKILDEYEATERQIEIYRHRISGSEPFDFSEIKAEVSEVYALHQNFIKRLSEIQNLEEIGLLKKEAARIEERMKNFLEKIKRVAPKDISQEIIRLQHALSEKVERRDTVINEINELKINIRVGKERCQNLENIISESTEEQERMARHIERLSSGSKMERESKIGKQKTELEEKLKQADTLLADAQKKIDAFNDEEQGKKNSLFSLQKEIRDKQNLLNQINNKVNEIKVALARIETKKEDLEHQIKEELPEDFWSKVFKEKIVREGSIDLQESENEILRLKHQIELIGGLDDGTQQEYQETKERHDFLRVQTDDLSQAISDLEKVISELDRTIESKFNSSFERINNEFGKYFKMLFNGGSAKLALVKEEIPDEEEVPLEEENGKKEEIKDESPKPEEKKKAKTEKVIAGVEIMATPPGKKLKNINMLSGGERALSSIALICAILHSNPSPFVVLDEVDAALDEANSMKFAKILSDLSHRSQFIVITHNRATMEKARILYGITMGDDGVSKMLSVKMEEAEEVIKAHGNR